MSLIPLLQDTKVRLLRDCVEDPNWCKPGDSEWSNARLYWDIQNLIRMLEDPGPLVPPLPIPPASPDRAAGGAASTWSGPPVDLNSVLLTGVLDKLMDHPNPQPNRPLPGTLGAIEGILDPAVRLESVRRMTERLEHTLEWLRADAERLQATSRETGSS